MKKMSINEKLLMVVEMVNSTNILIGLKADIVGMLCDIANDVANANTTTSFDLTRGVVNVVNDTTGIIVTSMNVPSECAWVDVVSNASLGCTSITCGNDPVDNGGNGDFDVYDLLKELELL